MLKFFDGLIDPYVPYDEDADPPKTVIGFVLSYVHPFRWVLAFNAVTAIATALAEVLLIFYVGRLVDLLARKNPAEFWNAHGWEFLFVLCFVLVIRPVVKLVDTALIRNTIQPHLAALGRWRAHNHVLKQPVGWFEADFAGRIANRVVYTPASIGELVFLTMNILAFVTAYFVGALSFLGSINVQFIIPLLIWGVMYGFLLRWALSRVRPAAKRTSAARSKTLGYIVDSYTNIQSVKLFDHSDSERKHMFGILENHRDKYAAENRIFTQVESGLVVLSGLLVVGLTGFALFMWSGGLVSVGIVASAAALALRLNDMTNWFMHALVNFFRALGVVSEGLGTLATPTQMKDKAEAQPFNFDQGRIELKDLKHSFGEHVLGLNGVSLDIKPGEKIGLVGRSGAGKSTLAKAVLRLYDPEQGNVIVDGQNVRDLSQNSLRSKIGMVQQETSLLHRSIRDNLLYSRPDASEAEMIAAAKKAEAHEFVIKLRDESGATGYDAIVGERGIKLSGGQRQRIALARVILKDAPILILDEATSALDSEVEAEIQTALYGMMEGKTVLAIAHRLSTIAQMDRIIVMDQGQVVEQGTHTQLLELDGQYANFWRHQSGGMIAMD